MSGVADMRVIPRGQCGFTEPSHPLQIFGMRAFSVRLCLGIHPGRPDDRNRIGHVLRPKSSGENDRYAYQFDDTPADSLVCRSEGRWLSSSR